MKKIFFNLLKLGGVCRKRERERVRECVIDALQVFQEGWLDELKPKLPNSLLKIGKCEGIKKWLNLGRYSVKLNSRMIRLP